MNLSENLHFLRKRDKITQEELADRLGVSRQAVSKWETGEAFPETDKLIMLCDMFNVSLDELVRGNAVKEEKKEEEPLQDSGGFIKHMDKFSRRIAAGVFLILFGATLCVLINGYALSFNNNMSDITAVFGAAAVLVCVAAAVFIFVYSGMEHDRFRKKYRTVSGVYSEKEVQAFLKRFARNLAVLCSGIIVDVVFLVVMSTLIDAGIITVSASAEDEAYCYVVSAFMFVLSFLVGGIVYYGIQHSKYEVSEYNRQNEKELNPSPRLKLKDAICGAIMMTAVALFLVIGFVWNLWHPGWIVFPVGGIICWIVGVIMNAKDDH